MCMPTGPDPPCWRTRRPRSCRCCDRLTIFASASCAIHTAGWSPRGSPSWPGTTRSTGSSDHWSLQADLLVADVIGYHVVGRFERFSQQFDAILRRLHAPPEVTGIARRVFNPTQPMPLAAVYDRQLARHVYDLYVADFETFGYHKDSWRYE